jgi:hypothetical protein
LLPKPSPDCQTGLKSLVFTLYRQSAAVLETAIEQIVQNPDSGDSFNPVAAATPVRSWKEIGFPLPPAPKKDRDRQIPSATIPQGWVFVKPGPLDPPMIQFRFPAPLDSYAGEITDASGEIHLPKDLTIGAANGFIEVDTRWAVTMGNVLLNEAIRGSMMLYTKKHPVARFQFDSVDSGDQKIGFGRLSNGSIRGIFTLKGKSVPLQCLAEFEPVLGEDQTPMLLIRTEFKIDLRAFGIEGADGPEPIRHTLLFDVNFVLKPKA